jgi:crotonobetainyl-CoA hydratase
MDSSDLTEGVTYEQDGAGVACITLRRDRVLNAINASMMRALWAALDEFHHDRSARVAVLKGAGRAFCAGADIREVPAAGKLDPAEDLSRMSDAFLARDRFKPLIASVHGHVVGAGLRMTLLSDFVICAESARFRAPEVQHGLDGGFYWTLIQARAGDAFAMDVVATGRPWSGRDAAGRGLVTRCVPDGALQDATLEFAASIASQPADTMEALVAVRRASLRALDLQAWTSRGRGLGWASPASLGHANDTESS